MSGSSAAVQRGWMDVFDLITHRFRPEQAAEVYARLAANRGGTLGVLCEWAASDS